MIGMGIQGYAIWAALSGSLVWPILWPSGVILYATILLIYYIGFCIQNATLASELIRKTQLESEQLAAQKIQKTLQPTTIDAIPGYEVDAFYKPLRAVGGDYFDVVDLPGNRTLFVVADVSGKGIAAALLAANIQAWSGACRRSHRTWRRWRRRSTGICSGTRPAIGLLPPPSSCSTGTRVSWTTSTPAIILRSCGVRGRRIPRRNRNGPGLVRRRVLRRRPDEHSARRWTSDLHRRTAGFDSGRQSGGQPVPGARQRSGPHDGQPQGAGGSAVQRRRRHRVAGEAKAVR